MSNDLPHRRRNLLTGEWVLVSPQRMKRPWQGEQKPVVDDDRATHDPQCYLCPGNDRAGGQRNPDYAGTFVFQNDFPALLAESGESSGTALFREEPACGEARVICYSPDHSATLARLDNAARRTVIDTWCEQSADLGARWRHVQIFENQGAMMGASSPHPHGQVWAGDFVPTIIEREDRRQREYFAASGQPLLHAVSEAESALDARVVAGNDHWLATVPHWAAWPFETLLIARNPVQRLEALSHDERDALASILGLVLGAYDALFETDFPYSMGWHGAPHGLGADCEHWRLHAHFFPPLLRSAEIRKHMVGFELLAETQRGHNTRSRRTAPARAYGMTSRLEEKAVSVFVQRFGEEPAGTVFAPGRVNLIGEHVDYNEGLVLPMPVREGTAIAWSVQKQSVIDVVAADLDESSRFDPASPVATGGTGWESYIRGMAAHAQETPPGMRLLVTGNLPRGSGLSSSASLCIAAGKAFAAAANVQLDAVSLAKAAQRTEHEYAGVACGIMDQMAVAAGQASHAMLLDCRDLSFRHVRLPAEWAVVIVESGVKRGLVDGEYNTRRQQCEAAAHKLGVPSLRDAIADDLCAAELTEVEKKRARHVIEEIARVKLAVDAIEQGDLGAMGEILRSGHGSLRDRFEVSVPALDTLVDELNSAIGHRGGARMTGAGFGGAAVAVLERDRAAWLTERIQRPVILV